MRKQLTLLRAFLLAEVADLDLRPLPPRFWGPSTCVSTLPTDHY